MKKIICIFLVFLIFTSTLFSYYSKYIETEKYSEEYEFLKNPGNFSIEKSVLLSYGITSSRDISYYTTMINQIADNIENKFNRKNKIKFAKSIFRYMHDNILKEYESMSYRIDTLLESGKYNCVSSTIFYNILLIKKGYNPQMVLTRDHTFTILNIDNQNIFIENTTEAGFNYINNPNLKNKDELIKNLKSNKYIVLNKKEMILSIYANRVYYIEDIKSSFQVSLKAIALEPESLSKYSNIKAGFFNYLNYLATEKNNYQKSYLIIKEALDNLNSYNFLLKRFKTEVHNYIISLVNKNSYEKALNILNESSNIIKEKSIFNDLSFYIHTNYGSYLYNQKDYKTAINKFNIAYKIKPENDTINKNLEAGYIMWAQNKLKNKNYRDAKKIINEGLNKFPNSPGLKQMKNYINKLKY